MADTAGALRVVSVVLAAAGLTVVDPDVSRVRAGDDYIRVLLNGTDRTVEAYDGTELAEDDLSLLMTVANRRTDGVEGQAAMADQTRKARRALRFADLGAYWLTLMDEETLGTNEESGVLETSIRLRVAHYEYPTDT